MKLNELYNPTFDEHNYSGFLKTLYELNTSVSNDEWIQSELIESLDYYILNKIGNRILRDKFASITKETYMFIGHLLHARNYTLNTLFITMSFLYNPINNYDRKETHSYTESFVEGSQTETITKGQKTDTLTDSGNTNTIEHGAQTHTSTDSPTSESINYGTQKITNNNGNQSNANNEKVFTFDGNEVDKTSSSLTTNAYTNTSETQAYTNKTDYTEKKNTLSVTAYNDSEIVGGKTITNVYGGSTDTNEKGQRSDTRSFNENINVSGNIGVMSTQQMIEQERQVALFNFGNVLINILSEEILKSEWECDYGY